MGRRSRSRQARADRSFQVLTPEALPRAVDDPSLSPWGYGGEAPMEDPPSLYRGVRERWKEPGQRRLPLAPTYGPRPTYLSSLKAAFNRLQLRSPGRVLFCLQRKVRREVLFAARVAGRKRSPGRGGRYRRTQKSQYSC